ncbi:SusC/RagA family TonB-linked outer membrane protein [Arcticibacter tournemirensis]|uniref:TonB-dependent receptor n=1 Tax=Arcticibacter tournemirensis TaxID=699437 RepID=A0A4Q0MCJ0_9SPHI|nr:TonB-dependent receptor [Arcticibacter tournemirensis]RXF71061.1 TonB-dependent receptor [Arcticibacter tournemirensis]
MKKKLQTQFHRNIGLRLICFGLLLSGFIPGVSYASSPAGLSAKAVSNARVNVTGTVKDSKGEPLVGVSVKIKGTKSGTSTDINGVFRLNLPTGNETLVITYIGFHTKEVVVKGQSTLSIQLTEEANNLDEVVVVGYGTQKRVHLTAAVQQIKLSEVEDLPVSNVSDALAGRLVNVSLSSSPRPGGVSTISGIRNQVAYSKDGGTTAPLFVIDGVVQMSADGSLDNTNFSNLDPSEVESISVLKDGSAAIYGSKAANGVVLVTTKKGKKGAPRISYSGSYAVNDEAYRPKVLSAYEYGLYYNIMNGPNGNNETNKGDGIYFFSDDELEHFKNVDYNWLEEEWKPSYNTRHSLSVSGGTETATFYAGASYWKQDGNISTLNYDKWNFRAGADVQVSKRLKAGLQLSGNYSEKQKTFNKVNSERDDDDYTNLLLAPRYIPWQLDGQFIRIATGSDKLSYYNFFALEDLNNLARDNNKTLTVNFNADYEIPGIKGLKARVNYGRNLSSGRGTQLGTMYTLYNVTTAGANGHIYDEGATLGTSARYKNGNRIYLSNVTGKSYQLNFALNFERQFGKHNVSGLVTVEKSEAESAQEDVWKEDPVETSNLQFNTAFGAIDGKTTGNESGTLSYIARANYNYANKYLAEFMYRTDASTRFHPDNYWGDFYSGSVGWIISEEGFFNKSFVNYLKIRYSIGFLGKDDTKAWRWNQRYTYQQGKGAVFGADNDVAGLGMKMEVSPNRDARWSDEFKNNLGIDASILNNRLSIGLDGYYNHGTDLLIPVTGNVPLTIGGSVTEQNYAIVDMFGYELSLGWNDKVGKDFRYGIEGRFSWSDNKVKKSNFNDTEILKPWNDKPNGSDDVGKWGYDYLGMFHDQQEIDDYVNKYNITQISLPNTNITKDDLRPGMLYYRDVRGVMNADGTFEGPDGIIDENDQVQLTKKEKNHYGFGLTLKASYKAFSFDCVVSGSFGGYAEMDGRTKMKDKITENYQSTVAYWGNIYDPELNPDGKYPNPYYSGVSLAPASSFWQVSSFRMRMRNFNLNYTLPNSISEKLKVKNCRVYFTAVNPFNFYNPFTYRDSDSAYDSYPLLKTYSFGVNLSL